MSLRHFYVKKHADSAGIDITEGHAKAIEEMMARGVTKDGLSTLVDLVNVQLDRAHNTKIALGRARVTPSKLGHEQ